MFDLSGARICGNPHRRAHRGLAVTRLRPLPYNQPVGPQDGSSGICENSGPLRAAPEFSRIQLQAQHKSAKEPQPCQPPSICGNTKSKLPNVIRNAPPAVLYEDAVIHEQAAIASSGALMIRSGAKTGRSPLDKRIVDHPDSSGKIWWGPVNIRLKEDIFIINRQRAIDFLNTRDTVYVLDGYAGWAAAYRLKIRVICAGPTMPCSCETCCCGRPTPNSPISASPTT